MTAVRTPLVSVVTPCHDAAPFVGETIASVLAQTHPSVEQVVVDDASADGSWAVIEGFAAARPDRVRALRLERNAGGSAARNRGAGLARGDYLVFLDADDLLAPDALAALVAALEAEPEAGIAVCPWARLRERPGGGWEEAPADAPLPPADPDAALRGWIAGSAWAPPCALMWRRAAYERAGGWDEALTLNDDGDLAMRALAAGTRVARAAGGRALYRWHGGARVSVSQSFVAEARLRSQARVLDKLAAELEARGRLDAFAAALGRGYRHVAYHGYQNGHRALAREAEARGRALGGHHPVSPRPLGRLLERVLGLEAKEELTRALARVGIASAGRRRIARLRAAGGGAP